MTPIYNTFFNSIVNNNRIPVMCPMDYVGGEFYVDYEKLGAMLSDPKVTMMILCNPHNPLGRIWNKEELAHIGKLAKKNNVVVLSDEVHGELTAPGKTYIPFASVNEECRNNSIACLSTSKCFNMAAIHSAIAYVPNVELYEKINRALNTDEVAEPNFFAGVGAIAALNNGREWLDEVRTVIQNNRDLLEKFIQKELPELHVIHGEATYLIFVDCSSLCEEASILTEHLRKTTGLWVQSGEVYRGNGKSFFRINVATPEKVLRDGLRRLKEGVESFKKRNHS